MDISLLLPLLLIIVLGGMFFFRNRQATKARQEQKSKLAVGVDVMTNFGLFGTVVNIDQADNKVTLETSPGNTVTVHAQTIGRIMDPAAAGSAPGGTTTGPAAGNDTGQPNFTVPDDASSLTDGTKPQAGPADSLPADSRPADSRPADQGRGNRGAADTSHETPEQTLARLRREQQQDTDKDK